MAQQPDPQVIAALTYQRQVQNLRAQLAAYVARLWVSLGAYRAEQMASFVDQVVPVVNGAQQNVAALTVAYLASLKQLATGGLGSPVAIDPAQISGAIVRNGALPQTVYERPFHLVWRQLDELPREPGSIDQAIQAGLGRATELALDDVQLSKRQAGHLVMAQDKGISGYRRVLEGAKSCGLCIVASTARYHTGQLMPIHGGCDCSVAPIYGVDDPGHVIDPETLDDVHQRIEERFGVNAHDAAGIPAKGLPDYRDILITHQHGELGPVLGVRGQPFLGPGDLH